MTEREYIVELARSCLGVKWRHQGRNPLVSLDCGGLIVWVGKEMGYIQKDWDMIRYDRAPDGKSLSQALALWCDPKPAKDLAPGDILLLRPDMHRWPVHLAVASERGGVPYMVHAWAIPRKTVENVYDKSWKALTVGVYQWKGLEA